MIAILNYGLGNLKAFANVYENINVEAVIASNEKDLVNASKIILPGVGSFDQAMSQLNSSGMRKILDHAVLELRLPVLGICVGMQMLARSSEEGCMEGLSYINAEVKKFDVSKLNYKPKLPHMGWNTIKTIGQNPLLLTIDQEPRFYFLHSYYMDCNDRQDIISLTDYGIEFASTVNHKNIYGVQFHPEKSHENGIKLLRNFARL